MINFWKYNKENASEKVETGIKEKENKQGCLVELIVMIVAIVVIVILAYGLYQFVPIKKIMWILIPLVVILYSRKSYFFMSSAENFRKIMSNKSEEKLSIFEQFTVFTIGMFVSFIFLYDLLFHIKDKAFRVIVSNVEGNLGEILYITLYCVLIYILFFFICIIASSLSLSVYKGLMSIKRVMEKNNIAKKTVIFAKKIAKRDEIIQCTLVNKISYLKKGIIKTIIIPFSIIIDGILEAFYILFSILEDGVAYLILSLMFIFNVITHFFRYVSKLSQRRIIRLSCRFSLIIAVALTVIMNRLMPIVTLNKNVTAIVEFVGSAIVIPLILESVVLLKGRKKQNRG